MDYLLTKRQVFFYAHKYQIEKLTSRLKEHLNQRMNQGISNEPYSLFQLEESIKMAELYSLVDYKQRLDQVKLSISDENALKFYELCFVFNMNDLLFQIAEYLKTKPIQESWPFDLIKRVFDQNRQDINSITAELAVLKTQKVKTRRAKHSKLSDDIGAAQQYQRRSGDWDTE